QPPFTVTVDTVRPGPPPTVSVFSTYGPLSALGEQRLEWYRRLDVRYTHDIETSRGEVSFFADLLNVFNATNPRYNNYSISYNNGKLSVRPVPNSQIGRLPSAGVSWKF